CCGVPLYETLLVKRMSARRSSSEGSMSSRPFSCRSAEILPALIIRESVGLLMPDFRANSPIVIFMVCPMEGRRSETLHKCMQQSIVQKYIGIDCCSTTFYL